MSMYFLYLINITNFIHILYQIKKKIIQKLL